MRLVVILVAFFTLSTVARAADNAPPIEEQMAQAAHDTAIYNEAMTHTRVWKREYDAGNNQAALASALKTVEILEKGLGPEDWNLKQPLIDLARTYVRLGDNASASTNFSRALNVFVAEYGVAMAPDSCWLASLVGRMIDSSASEFSAIANPRDRSRAAVEKMIAAYEHAVACYERHAPEDKVNLLDAVFQLAWWYRSNSDYIDRLAKGEALLDSWIAKTRNDPSVRPYFVTKLMRGRADFYYERGNKTASIAMNRQAMALLESEPPELRQRPASLQEEVSLIQAIEGSYSINSRDEYYLAHLARLVDVLKALNDPSNAKYLGYAQSELMDLRQKFPAWRSPSEIEAARIAARNAENLAAVQAKANAITGGNRPVTTTVTPVQQGLRGVDGAVRSTPAQAVLKAPKGYEFLRPAHLYSLSIETLGDPRWIVAKSKAEAIDLGNRLFAFYDRFNTCLASCEDTIALDFGWVAIIQAFRPGTGNSPKKFGVYVAYAATSRQAAIDKVLADYRARRGSEGPIAQSLRVGIVAELNWSKIAEKRDPELIPGMDTLHYLTFCDWSQEYGPNMNAEPTTGNVDRDPACVKYYQPEDKLPPPVLSVNR